VATVVLVAVGGAFGTLARYGLAGIINNRSHPWGTVAVNVIGSLLLGLMVGYWGFGAASPGKIALAVGVLGGFTTFSTFALDTIYLWQKGEATTAMVTLAVTVLVGIGAAVVGIIAGRALTS
jgi:fluoride exporter